MAVVVAEAIQVVVGIAVQTLNLIHGLIPFLIRTLILHPRVVAIQDPVSQVILNRLGLGIRQATVIATVAVGVLT